MKCIYNIGENVLPKDLLEFCLQTPYDNSDCCQEYVDRAEHNKPKEGETYSCYRSNREDAFYEIIDSLYSGSYPTTGNLSFSFCDCLRDAEESLILYVEDAKTELTLKKEEKELKI